MSKHILKLHDVGIGDTLKQYMHNLGEISKVKKCVSDSRFDNNIYKTVASFEDAGITSVQEVPTGSPKQKMNYLLAQAISKVAPSVQQNLHLAGQAAKEWNDVVVIDNQQERLNVALSKLRTPVKDSIIPSYSSMNDGQRQRVQSVFQTVLKKEEPLSIDFITNIIDRYNAGADKTVMFKALGLELDYSNSIAVYDENAYLQLMNSDTFAYLLSRWESYQNIVSALGNERSLTPETLIGIITNAGYATVPQMDSVIKKAIANVGFNSAIDEYNDNAKPTTNYNDIKPYMSGENVVTPLSVNNLNRLKALCNIISKLQDSTIYQIDEQQTDMESDDIYAALSSYFNVMEEVTQNLMVFLFLTQITTRNNTLIEDVIVAVNMVDSTIDSLFVKVNNAVIEDGNISQEGFKDILNKILGKDKAKPEESYEPVSPHLLGHNQMVNMINNHLEISDMLFRIKLRDSTSLSEDRLNGFKATHKERIKDMFDVNIGSMDIDEVYSFMTSDIFGKKIKFSAIEPLTCDLFLNRDPISRKLVSVIQDHDKRTRLLHLPFVEHNDNYSQSCGVALVEFGKLMSVVYHDYTPAEVKAVVTTVFDNYVDIFDGSFYPMRDDLEDILPSAIISRANGTPFESAVSGEKSVLGFRNVDITSQHKVLSYFVPNKKNTLTLNNIKNNIDIVNFCKLKELMATYYEYAIEFSTGKVNDLNGMVEYHDACLTGRSAIKSAISECTEFSKEEVKQYITAVDAMLGDMESSIVDAKARVQLVTAINAAAQQTADSLNSLFTNFNEIAEDFISISK